MAEHDDDLHELLDSKQDSLKTSFSGLIDIRHLQARNLIISMCAICSSAQIQHGSGWFNRSSTGKCQLVI
jgi:hypothetical protein